MAESEPAPLDPKEASRWIASQIRAKRQHETGVIRASDPEPLDPAEASKLIAERIKAKGQTAVRPAEPMPDHVMLARPMARERLLALLQGDPDAPERFRGGEGTVLKAEVIALAEFEFLVQGGRPRGTREIPLGIPGGPGSGNGPTPSDALPPDVYDAKTRMKRRDESR